MRKLRLQKPSDLLKRTQLGNDSVCIWTEYKLQETLLTTFSCLPFGQDTFTSRNISPQSPRIKVQHNPLDESLAEKEADSFWSSSCFHTDLSYSFLRPRDTFLKNHSYLKNIWLFIRCLEVSGKIHFWNEAVEDQNSAVSSFCNFFSWLSSLIYVEGDPETVLWHFLKNENSPHFSEMQRKNDHRNVFLFFLSSVLQVVCFCHD